MQRFYDLDELCEIEPEICRWLEELNGEGVNKGKIVDRPAAPAWLPLGWGYREKTRTGGKTKGVVDRFYTSPGGKHKFRSKVAVLEYLRGGIPPQRKPLKPKAAKKCVRVE